MKIFKMATRVIVVVERNAQSTSYLDGTLTEIDLKRIFEKVLK